MLYWINVVTKKNIPYEKNSIITCCHILFCKKVLNSYKCYQNQLGRLIIQIWEAYWLLFTHVNPYWINDTTTEKKNAKYSVTPK